MHTIQNITNKNIYIKHYPTFLNVFIGLTITLEKNMKITHQLYKLAPPHNPKAKYPANTYSL